MADIKDIKEYILSLSESEKDKLLIKLLRKNKEEIDRIYLTNIAENHEVDEYFEATIEEIKEFLSHELYNRGNFHKNMARGIGKANKLIKKRASVINKPEKELALLMHLLSLIFENFHSEFGTCWTVFDHKVAQTLSRAVTLITKKVHPDYRIEFVDLINEYLNSLKRTSRHLDYVYNMPDQI